MTNLKNLDFFYDTHFSPSPTSGVLSVLAGNSPAFGSVDNFNFRYYSNNFQTGHVKACSDWVSYFSAFSEVWSFFLIFYFLGLFFFFYYIIPGALSTSRITISNATPRSWLSSTLACGTPFILVFSVLYESIFMLYNNEVFSARIVPLFLIEGRQWKWEYRYNVASLLEHGAIQKSVGNGVSARGVSLNPLEVNIFKKKAVSLLGQELAEQGLRVKSELLKSKGSGVSLWDLSFNFFTVSGNSNSGRATTGVSGDLFNRFRVSENTRRLLTANRSVALPDTALTKALITGCDVIHSWTLPGLGVRIDAVPGKVYALKVPFKYYGVFNGQCSEVCGLRHAYMPIAVNFVTYSFFIKIIYMHFFASVDFFVRSYLSALEADSKKDRLPYGPLAFTGKDAAYAEQAAVTDFIYGENASTPQ